MRPLVVLRHTRRSAAVYVWRSPWRFLVVAIAAQWRFGCVRSSFVVVRCVGPLTVAITDLERR